MITRFWSMGKVPSYFEVGQTSKAAMIARSCDQVPTSFNLMAGNPLSKHTHHDLAPAASVPGCGAGAPECGRLPRRRARRARAHRKRAQQGGAPPQLHQGRARPDPAIGRALRHISPRARRDRRLQDRYGSLINYLLSEEGTAWFSVVPGLTGSHSARCPAPSTAQRALPTHERH